MPIGTKVLYTTIENLPKDGMGKIKYSEALLAKKYECFDCIGEDDSKQNI